MLAAAEMKNLVSLIKLSPPDLMVVSMEGMKFPTWKLLLAMHSTFLTDLLLKTLGGNLGDFDQGLLAISLPLPYASVSSMLTILGEGGSLDYLGEAAQLLGNRMPTSTSFAAPSIISKVKTTPKILPKAEIIVMDSFQDSQIRFDTSIVQKPPPEVSSTKGVFHFSAISEEVEYSDNVTGTSFENISLGTIEEENNATAIDFVVKPGESRSKPEHDEIFNNPENSFKKTDLDSKQSEGTWPGDELPEIGDEESEVEEGEHDHDTAGTEELNKPKKKKKKVQEKKVARKNSEGLFVLDAEEVKRKYPEDPEHVERILALPRSDNEWFWHEGERIAGKNNPKFLKMLFTSSSAAVTFAAYNLTVEAYEEETGEKFVPVQKLARSVARKGRGKDKMVDAVGCVKSGAWLSGLCTIYNMLVDFVAGNPEFRNVDWVGLAVADLDMILGYFFLWCAPLDGMSALGSNYTPDTLKNIKCKLQKVLEHFLKRSDFSLSGPKAQFSKAMYDAKQTLIVKRAGAPGEGVQGDRQRVSFTPEDQSRIDEWILSKEKMRPEDLQDRVAAIFFGVTCSRGVNALIQLRRSYVKFETDERGNKVVRISGNVSTKTKTQTKTKTKSTKTDQGKGGNYKPFNCTIYGQSEVIFLLLNF